MVETTKVTLVTVIATFELEDRLLEDLKRLGVKGYSVGKVDGRGVHGPHTAGLVDAPNLRFEMLVQPPMAARILERVATRYEDQPIIAYAHQVETITSV